MLQTVGKVPVSSIFDSASSLLSWASSSAISNVDIYVIHSPKTLSQSTVKIFWRLQATIILELRRRRELAMLAVIVHPSCDNSTFKQFIRTLNDDKWRLSECNSHLSAFGDSINDDVRVLFGVHRCTAPTVEPLSLITPPHIQCRPISDFIHDKFQHSSYAISFAKDSINFVDDTSRFTAVLPKSPSIPTSAQTSRRLYDLVLKSDTTNIVSGCGVFDTNHLFPPLSRPCDNIFGRTFGIEFDFQSERFIRPISPFEFARGFGFSDELTMQLSHSTHLHLLHGGIPKATSHHIFDCIYARLIALRNTSFEVIDNDNPPSAAPAAFAQSLFNGAIGARLPSSDQWADACRRDSEMNTVLSIVSNPSLAVKAYLSKVHHVYRKPLRLSMIKLEDGMLVLYEPLAGSSECAKLRLVPTSLRNIVFIAFHSNPVGGHFNAYRTFTRIRLRFHWPGMYGYVTNMCSKCVGCNLSNANVRRSSELVYNFPMDAPMLVLHVDGYSLGKIESYEGTTSYLVAACGMTGFTAIEGVREANSTSFSSAIMRIQLRYGMAHTLVLDKDSKFYSVFRETCDLLGINTHTLSAGNHDGMAVERINRYLNKTMKIFTSERGSDPRVAHEGLLMAVYAWNSAPVPVDSKPKHAKSFARRQAVVLKASHEVAKVLWTLRPDPKVYQIGDHVFVRRVVKSVAKKSIVGKAEFAYTGPWEIVKSFDGASYECKHVKSGAIDKFHSAHLSPVPLQLIPFLPLDGPDSRFGQLHKPIKDDAYKLASIEEFLPKNPFKININLVRFADEDDSSPFHWPSLAELNAELDIWDEDEIDLFVSDSDPIAVNDIFALPSLPPPVPCAARIAALITQSTDKLFFIAYTLPNTYRCEWYLTRVAFADSIALHPQCLEDGKYLMDFFICHPNDMCDHPLNQRFWLEYHNHNDVARLHSGEYHVLRPDKDADNYALENGLQPFRQWIYLSSDTVFIHGPFNFAIINGRQSKDRIALDDWNALSAKSSMVNNIIPDANARRANSIHYSSVYHQVFTTVPVSNRVKSVQHVHPTLFIEPYIDDDTTPQE
eukprot:g7453.t1 g7453   contig24:661092-664348(-)